MSAAHRYLPHYTIDDYQHWEGDWELWQGIPVAMTPSPFGVHQRIAKNLVFELESQIRQRDCSATVLFEIDWIVSRDTIVRPDVVVVRGAPPERHVESVPTLVAEIVSDSTAARDREAKRDLYRDQGVTTYVLIDPSAKNVVIHSRSDSDQWIARNLDDSAILRFCDHCVVEIAHESLFR